MRNISILALGSRGDVQPFVALGTALQARGYEVRIAAAADYRALAEDAGMPFAPVGGFIRELMDFELVYQALDASRHALPIGFARRFLEHVGPLVRQIVADCWAAAQGCDALVVSSLGCFPGAGIAERLGVPLILAHMHPSSATREWPDVSFPALPAWLPMHGAYNLLTHALATHGMWQLLRGALIRARREVLGLPALGPLAQARRAAADAPALTLNAYSPLLAPRPADWDARQCVTGYWALPAPTEYQPPPALAEFLAAGPPPVYLGFGSLLLGRDPAGVTRTLVDALGGRRAVLFRGWGDVDDSALPATIFATDAVPHSWLFPRVAAVVTHGGAGTVAAALRAGVPPVVVPFFGDQRLWGAQVQRLGVGPPPIPRAALTAPALARAIEHALSDGAMRERAAALGAQLRAEKGAHVAAELIARIV
jgi:UDP:flavonoid glycosyltransferase YjiC (YdhE family)